MAKQQMNPVPYLKHMEAYNDFSGGLNTVTSDDNLKDNEFKDLTNVDLAERGPAKRRTGMVLHLEPSDSPPAQGYFRYFKQDGSIIELEAIDGMLFANGNPLNITGLTSFQTTRPVEAVQYKDKMYIATGTKLVVYDGTEAKVVVPHKPDPLEALYIGTNALADNPNDYLSDGTSAALQVTGVILEKRYGIVNRPNTFTAYISRPAAGTVEYRWEWRPYGTDEWKSVVDFSSTRKSVPITLGEGEYEIRCIARMQGDTQAELYPEYRVPKYTVKETDQNKVEDTSTIHQCNRIILHWERIILYGDPKQKDMIYVSDVGRPDYVPTLNTLRFENTEQEALTALVKFRDMLVAFTPHTIQGLYGKSPYDFSRLVLSSSVGCIAPYSAQVFENYVAFLSLEGVYILKSVGYSETRANVQKIDTNIANIVPRDTDACAIVADGQYQIVFPSKYKRFRFYYQRGVWTKDESPKLNFIRMYEFNGQVYGQSPTSGIFRMDKSVYTDDDYVYADQYVFKDFDFGHPYNPKKLKELQILLGQVAKTGLGLTVYADGAEIVNSDASYASIVNGEVVWNTVAKPNINIEVGTVFGSWVLGSSAFGNVETGIQYVTLTGKCRKVGIKITHSEATPNTILGFGFIYKLRKP